MNSSALPYWLSLMVLVAGSYGGWKLYEVNQHRASQSAGGLEFKGSPLKEFTLEERSGQKFRSEAMRGKVWVTTFFFSTCPGSCSRLNANIKHMNSLDALRDVTWVSITVDPETDTLPVLREYANRFDADPKRWLFCRADMNYIKRVGEDVMKLPITWQSHNDYAVVIDKMGQVRGMYDATSNRQMKKLGALLEKCLAEEHLPDGANAETQHGTIRTEA